MRDFGRSCCRCRSVILTRRTSAFKRRFHDGCSLVTKIARLATASRMPLLRAWLVNTIGTRIRTKHTTSPTLHHITPMFFKFLKCRKAGVAMLNLQTRPHSRHRVHSTLPPASSPEESHTLLWLPNPPSTTPLLHLHLRPLIQSRGNGNDTPPSQTVPSGFRTVLGVPGPTPKLPPTLP